MWLPGCFGAGYCGYQVTFGQITMINVVTRLLLLPGCFGAGYYGYQVTFRQITLVYQVISWLVTEVTIVTVVTRLLRSRVPELLRLYSLAYLDPLPASKTLLTNFKGTR